MPESEFAWKPHDKSFSLGQLAGHVANIPTWVGHILQNSVFDVSTAGDTRPRQPESLAILLADFDKNVKAARAALPQPGMAKCSHRGPSRVGAGRLHDAPSATLRSFIMNHLIHHRGQLTVYLRLKNVPVPSVYGPTADEQ